MPDTTTRPWLCPRDETCPSSTHDSHGAHRMGCDSGAAREARRLYLKRWKNGRQPSAFTDPVGVRRRIEACYLAGWSGPQLAAATGLDPRSINFIRRGDRNERILVETYRRIAPILERLAMATPPAHMHRQRTINWARREGFRPLLAWDDIDDPNETPTGEQRTVDTIRTLTARGFTQAQIAERLGLSVTTVRKRLGPVSAVPVELDEHRLAEATAGRCRFDELSDVEQNVVVERLWARFLPTCAIAGKPSNEVAARLGVDRVVVERIHHRLRTRAYRAEREAS